MAITSPGAAETSIINSDIKLIEWLFTVTDTNDVRHYWSFSDIPYTDITGDVLQEESGTVLESGDQNDTGGDNQDGTNAFIFKIMSFGGLNLRRGSSENRILAPSDVTFVVSNDSNSLTASDFTGGVVWIHESISDGTNSFRARKNRFTIKTCEPGYQKLTFVCEDFIREFLRGDYPNTRLIKDIFPGSDTDIDDQVCIPEPYGTAYIPIRSDYLGNILTTGAVDTISFVAAAGFYAQVNDSDSGLGIFEANRFVNISGASNSENNGTFYVFSGFAGRLELSTKSGIVAEDAAEGTVTITQGSRYYILGDTRNSYNLHKVRSPRSWGRKSEWADLNWIKSGGTDEYYAVNQSGGAANLSEPVDWDGTSLLRLNGVLAEKATVGALAAEEWGYSGGLVYVRLIDSTDPDSKSGIVNYVSIDFPFTQSTKADGDAVDWRVFKPIIADSNTNGFANANGLWRQGDHFLDMPTQFSRSDTISKTDPADVIKQFLLNIGADTDDIDHDTFTAASSIFAGYSVALEFNGAYWFKQPRVDVINQLLSMCNAILISEEKIQISILSKASQKTFDKASVIKPAEKSEGTFRYRDISSKFLDDAAYCTWQQVDEAQDEFHKILVPIGASVTKISSDILRLPFLQDSRDAQQASKLYYKRKLGRIAEVSLTAKATCTLIQPGDVVTMNHGDYGGNYEVLVDEVNIARDGSVSFWCSRFSTAFADWDDAVPNDITISIDDTTEMWEPSVGGPTTKNELARGAFKYWGRAYIYVSPIENQGQYTDIQDAVNALVSNNKNTIYLMNGTYTLDSVVQLPNRDVEIIGESEGGVIIQNNAGDNGFSIYNRTSTYRFSNFTITSQNSGSYSDMISIFGDTAPQNTSSVFVSNVTFNLAEDGTMGSSNADNGVWCRGGESGSIDVTGCTFTGGRLQVFIFDWENPKVLGNQFNRPQVNAINIANGITADNNITDYESIAIAGAGGVFTGNVMSYQISITPVDDTKGMSISSSATDAVVSGNKVIFNNNRANALDHIGIDLGWASSAVSNIVSVIGNTTGTFIGVAITGSRDVSVGKNNIKVSNSDNSNPSYCVNVDGDTGRHVVSNNNFTMTGDVNDICIIINTGTNDCQIKSNNFYNFGTTIINGGSGTIISGNTEPGVNMSTQDGQFARAFMSMV